MHKNLFISVEGIDGAGKSTHLKFIKKYLESKYYNVATSREPGGSVVGEQIRSILLNNDSIHNITELLLMFASRQELLTNFIVPNLNQGNCVLLDRFIDASIAYQGGGRNIDMEIINSLIYALQPQISTDITFLFDVPVSIAYKRIEFGKYRIRDRIEKAGMDFFERVRLKYLEIARQEPDRIFVINTDDCISNIERKIMEYLDAKLS